MIRHTQALALIERRCTPVVAIETPPLAALDGRILATDVVAPIALPPADNSAVDGYAFRQADLGRGGTFRLIGTAAAGWPFEGAVGQGEAVRILTGANPPVGADAIAMQEVVQVDGAHVTIAGDIRLNDNLRRAGEDVALGAQVLAVGKRLGPTQIGMLAALGIAEVPVRRKLRVAVLSAGDELVEAGAERKLGQINDANRPVLLAMLRRLGMAPTDFGIVPDSRDALQAALSAAARDHDVIVSSAGVSVGDEDHMRAAVKALGDLDFWSVAIKPGRPVTAGHVAGVPFFGLPGNPVAMLVTFLTLARPGLLRLAGETPRPPRRFPVVADFALRKKAGRLEYLRGSLHDRDGALCVSRYRTGGSGILSSVTESEGLIEISEDIEEVAPGMALPFIPFSEFGL
jgi:molybdopterin molybdotransferase